MSTEHDNRRVSETYRDVANEASPTHLDDRILALARQEARTRYGLARAWIRPVAWAATIALSFAFILEMTYFDDMPAVLDAAIPESPARMESAESDAAEIADTVRQAPAFKRATPSAVIAAPEIQATELPALREAEQRVDDVASGYAEKAEASLLRTEIGAYDNATSVDRCDAAARLSAGTWYHCIVQLRERGLDDAAAAELAELREAFPDFREPVPE